MHGVNVAWTYAGKKSKYREESCFSFLGRVKSAVAMSLGTIKVSWVLPEKIEKLHYKPPELDAHNCGTPEEIEQILLIIESFVRGVVKYEKPRAKTATARYNSGVWIDPRKYSGQIITGALQCYRWPHNSSKWVKRIIELVHEYGIDPSTAIVINNYFARSVRPNEHGPFRGHAEQKLDYSTVNCFNAGRVKLRKHEEPLVLQIGSIYYGVDERLNAIRPTRRLKTKLMNIPGSRAWSFSSATIKRFCAGSLSEKEIKLYREDLTATVASACQQYQRGEL